MAYDTGWIKLHRQILDSDAWLQEPFTRGQAWVDMLLIANHKEGSILVRGITLKIDRGQLGWSEEKLAKRWKWSRGKVRRFLSNLGSDSVHQIVQQKNAVSSMITILNYDKYQSDDTTNDTTNDTTDGHQTDIRRYTNKNDKNEKNEKNNTPLSPKWNSEIPEKLRLIPDFLTAWDRWQKYKVEKKQKLTESTKSLQLKKLEKSPDPIAMINFSIEKGYTGLFQPDGNAQQIAPPEIPMMKPEPKLSKARVEQLGRELMARMDLDLEPWKEK
jgi:hypothetical protein